MFGEDWTRSQYAHVLPHESSVPRSHFDYIAMLWPSVIPSNSAFIRSLVRVLLHASNSSPNTHSNVAKNIFTISWKFPQTQRKWPQNLALCATLNAVLEPITVLLRLILPWDLRQFQQNIFMSIPDLDDIFTICCSLFIISSRHNACRHHSGVARGRKWK